MSTIPSPALARSPESKRLVAATATAGEERAPATSLQTTTARPVVGGKFLFVGDEKLYLRGVTYGPFGPDGSAAEYGDPARVDRDFADMTAAGINAVRVYSVPPPWLLDAAAAHRLLVLVGLPWEQHVAFLDDASRAADIARRVAAGVGACAGHPSVLAYAIGNEVPAPVVRWYGHRRVERYLRR